MNTPYLGISMLIHITIVLVVIVYRRTKWLWQKFQASRFSGLVFASASKYSVRKPVKALALGLDKTRRALSSFIIFMILTLIMLNAVYIIYMGETSPSSNIKVLERNLGNLRVINQAQ